MNRRRHRHAFVGGCPRRLHGAAAPGQQFLHEHGLVGALVPCSCVLRGFWAARGHACMAHSFPVAATSCCLAFPGTYTSSSSRGPWRPPSLLPGASPCLNTCCRRARGAAPACGALPRLEPAVHAALAPPLTPAAHVSLPPMCWCQVPANRLGHLSYGGPFTAPQLKTVQEAVRCLLPPAAAS